MTEKRFTFDGKDCFDNGEFWLDLGLPTYSNIREICNMLNELAEEKKELQVQCNLLREQANEFHRGARENANRVGQLEKENKELKKQMNRLYNYFMDWYSDEMGANQFSEMWGMVKEDERWDCE